MPVIIGEPLPEQPPKRPRFSIRKRTWLAIGAVAVLGLSAVGAYYYVSERDLADIPVSYAKVKANQATVLEGVEEDPQPVSATVDNSLESVREVSENEIALAQARDALGQSQNTLVGGLWMPDIGLNLGVYSGFGGDNQYLGACTYTPDHERTMGSGNYVLVGHNSTNPRQLFSPLKKVTVGWNAYLTNYDTVFTYRVTATDIVPQTKVELVADTEENVMTLLTCYGGNGTDQRRYVRLELVDATPLSDSSEDLQNHFTSQ